MLKLKRYNIEPEWRVDKEWIKIEDPSGEFVLYDDCIQMDEERVKLGEIQEKQVNIIHSLQEKCVKQEEKIKELELKTSIMRDHIKLLEESLLKKRVGENLEVK